MSKFSIGDRIEVVAQDSPACGLQGIIKLSSMAVGMWGIEFDDGRGGWISELDLKPLAKQKANHE